MKTKLIHADFRVVGESGKLDGKLDAIITDPPYPRAYWQLWPALFRFACRTLKPGGSLLSIIPHHMLNDVLYEVEIDIDIKYDLKYRWIFAMVQTEGTHPRMAMGVEVCWKPIVWWVKGSYPQGRGYTVDLFENRPPKKEVHPWQQSEDWARFCLREQFVPQGGVVCDPMMGSGTLLVVAQEARPDLKAVIGIEQDSRTFNAAQARRASVTR